MSLTPKLWAESIARHPASTTAHILAAKRLREDMDGMGMADAPVMDAPAEGGDPDEALWTGFEAAIRAILAKYKTDGGGKPAARAAAKDIQKYLVNHADLTDGGGADEPADAEEPPALESKRPALKDLIAECEAAGLKRPTVEQLARIERFPTREGRADAIGLLLESRPATGASCSSASKGSPSAPSGSGRGTTSTS